MRVRGRLNCENGFADSWILGLTNDYQSYFTTETEYNERAYDSCSSLFRWKGAQRIQTALADLMSAGKNDNNIAE